MAIHKRSELPVNRVTLAMAWALLVKRRAQQMKLWEEKK